MASSGHRPSQGRPRPTIAVEVSDRQRLLRVSVAGVERLLHRALAAERITRARIGVVLLDDRRIAAVHRRWLGVDGATDVITFDLSATPVGPDADGLLAGDIVASTETAIRSARAFGWTPRQELAYYLVHGLLHLTGYDDRSPTERRSMRARERAVMKACGLPCPRRTHVPSSGR